MQERSIIGGTCRWTYTRRRTDLVKTYYQSNFTGHYRAVKQFHNPIYRINENSCQLEGNVKIGNLPKMKSPKMV